MKLRLNAKTTALWQSGAIRWYLLGTLIAVELLMSFSFLGYFHVEPISITVAYIPVLAAGALLGPADSAIVGAVFGLASMWKASASYIIPFDQLFSPIMSGYPLRSLLLSVGSRTLFGLVIGFLYLAARKSRRPLFLTGVVSFLGRTIHSVFVYTALWAFFPETGYTPLDAFLGFWQPNALLTGAVSAAIVLAALYLMHLPGWNLFLARIQHVRQLQLGEHYHILSLVAVILITLVSAFAVTIYFIHRMDYVLAQKGILLPDSGYADLVHLQIQFLFGILALMALVIIFLIFNRRYATYSDWESRTDSLTGAMNRNAFFRSCEKILSGQQPDGKELTWFLMLDMDCFKEINDRYGHPEGDRILKELVQKLKNNFHRDALIGRIGGDEFALLTHTPLSKEELELRLRHFLHQIHEIPCHDFPISCSIGAQPAGNGQSIHELYRLADELLYIAKKQGKEQFVIGSSDSER